MLIGIIKCQDCDWESEGLLPEGKPAGSFYLSTEHELDFKTVKSVQQHHLDTERFFGTLHGHSHFDAFLPDGRIGEIEADSYEISLSYNEKGKERG